MKVNNCCSNKISEGIKRDCSEFSLHNKTSKVKFNVETEEVFDEWDNYLGQGVWDGRTLQLKSVNRQPWYFIEPN